VTYPVKYSFSLQNYNPAITQIHLELTPGGAVAQYTDYNGNNLLWMVLNPGPINGQVVCNVQWKTNAPSSNPGGTVNAYGNALSFTNSTAVGTWSLVFTGTNTGYVSAPGQVILGPTNFTIADENIATDFGNPMNAVFGMYKEEDMFNAAMDSGARAFVLKENAVNEIIAALDKVDRGDTFLSRLMLGAGQRRSDRVRQLLVGRPQIEALTPAERRILKLIGEDYTSKEIASLLQLSVRTVDNHRQHICNKLNLHGSHGLLKFAFDNSAYL